MPRSPRSPPARTAPAQIEKVSGDDRAVLDDADPSTLFDDVLDRSIGRILHERHGGREARRMDTRAELSLGCVGTGVHDERHDGDTTKHPCPENAHL